MLRDLLHEAQFGSLNCMVLRVFRSDGGWEDLVLGGTQEERVKAQALWRDASEPGFPVVRMTLSAPVSAAAVATGKAAELLAEAIEAAHGSKPNVTVWLEVTQPDMPRFIAEALDRLAGCGAGIVVTHATPEAMHCSHPPGAQMSPEFHARLAKASRAGQVWHPLAQEPVPGIGI